jgi:hypothetical protein
VLCGLDFELFRLQKYLWHKRSRILEFLAADGTSGDTIISGFSIQDSTQLLRLTASLIVSFLPSLLSRHIILDPLVSPCHYILSFTPLIVIYDDLQLIVSMSTFKY